MAKISKKRAKKFSFLGGILTGLLFPLFKVFAILDLLTHPIKVVISFATALIIIFGISFGFVYSANAILGWVTSPGFVTTTIRDNVLVREGWTVVRDFTNLFFILVLVWIGIAVALRIKEYQATKALPRLVIVALLINFTPVICGVIIDASNIFMNFFLTAGTLGNNRLLNVANLSGQMLVGQIGNLWGFWESLKSGALFFQLLFVVAFNFIAGFVMLVMAMLFLVRHIALWVLVILAPLAFFMWILPETQRYWRMWWQQFIQWCLVGVGGAFFLFLTQVMIQNLDNLISTTQIQGDQVFLSAQVTAVLHYSVPLVLLLMGFFITTQTAPMGAKIITGFAQKQFKKMPSRLKKVGGWGARKAGEKYEKLGPVERAQEKARERARERLEWKAQKPSSWISARGERLRRMKEAVLMPTWRARRIAVKGTEQEIKNFDKLLEKYKKFETTEARLATLTKKRLSSTEKAAIIRAMFEKGEIDKISKGTLEEFMKKDILKVAEPVRKRITQAIPDIAEKERQRLEQAYNMAVAKGNKEKAKEILEEEKRKGILITEKDLEKGYTNMIEKIVGEAGPKEIENFSKELIKSKEARAAIHKFWSGREVSKAIEKFGRTFLDLFQQDVNETGAEFYKKHNPRLYRYLRSNAAQNLGLEAPLSEQERKEKSISPPPSFHGGQNWGILSEEEKEKMKQEIQKREQLFKREKRSEKKESKKKIWGRTGYRQEYIEVPKEKLKGKKPPGTSTGYRKEDYEEYTKETPPEE